MKKRIIALVILLLCAFAYQANATTYYAQAGSGNMSEIEWDTSAGGGGTDLVWANRQAGDVFDANAQTGIVVDADPGVGASKVVLTTGASGGGFIVNGTMTITADINAGTTTCLTFGAGTFTVTIAGNLNGGGTASTYAVAITGTGKTVNITGDVSGGSAGSALHINATATVAVTGNVTGGSGSSVYGIYCPSTGTLSVSNTATGGSAVGAHGIYYKAGSGGVATVVNCTGGTGIAADGIRITSTSSAVVTGNITNSATASGASGRITYTPAAATNWIKYTVTEAEFANVTASDVKTGVAYGSKTGTLVTSGGGAWAW
jgi:hypothetical protein